MTKLPFWATELPHCKLKILSFITWAAAALGYYCHYDVLNITKVMPVFSNEIFIAIVDYIAFVGSFFVLLTIRKISILPYGISEYAFSLISKWDRHYYGD